MKIRTDFRTEDGRGTEDTEEKIEYNRTMKYPLQRPRLYADFNGLFGDRLCLSHGEVCKDETGTEVVLKEGMIVTAYDEDADVEGRRNDLIATGIVERSPESLQCLGSRWTLRIDDNGVRSESDIPNEQR